MIKQMKLLKNFLIHLLKNSKLDWKSQWEVGISCLIVCHLLYYKCDKINPNHDGYIFSPDWIKNKIATINPINKKGNKSLQCAVTVT